MFNGYACLPEGILIKSQTDSSWIKAKKTSWWFQPIWKICSSNWIISPGIGVKIPKIFELPPPTWRIIPASKWLITMVNLSPIRIGVAGPLPHDLEKIKPKIRWSTVDGRNPPPVEVGSLSVYPIIYDGFLPPRWLADLRPPRASVVTIGDGTIREEGGENEVDFLFHVLQRWPKKKTADI